MVLRRLALVLCLLVLLGGGASAGKKKLSMIDKDGVAHGTASVSLEKGVASAKLELAPLPATIDTGEGEFVATFYKAYLVNSLDPAIEVPLGDVWPSSKSKAKVKAALKGDLAGLGLDRIVVVAFSKDGLSSFDVLSAALDPQAETE